MPRARPGCAAGARTLGRTLRVRQQPVYGHLALRGYVHPAVGDGWYSELHRRDGSVSIGLHGAVVELARQVLGVEGVQHGRGAAAVAVGLEGPEDPVACAV